MKVDFFIIGGPKCGTTALAQYLDSHSAICFSQPKETWFFSNDLYPLWQNTNSVEDYHKKFFKHYNSTTHKCVGEGTPLYMFSKTALSNILDYNSDAKFIVMLRNPIDMAYSYHSQLCFNGVHHEDVNDFEKAWSIQKERKDGFSLPKNVIEPQVLQYKEICSLGNQVKILLDRVNSDKIQFILFDDFKLNTESEYNKVLDFLNIEKDSQVSFKKINQNKEWNNHFSRNLFLSIRKLIIKYKLSLNLGILKKIKSFLIKKKPRKKLSTEFQRKLSKEFKSDNNLLSECLKKDLSKWLDY